MIIPVIGYPRIIEIPLITESGLKEAEEKLKEQRRKEKERKERLEKKRIHKFNKKRKELLIKLDKIIKKYNLTFEDFYIYNKIKREFCVSNNDIEKLIKSNIKFLLLSNLDKEMTQFKISVYDLSLHEEYKMRNKINSNNAYEKELKLNELYKEYIAKILGKNYLEIKFLKQQRNSLEEILQQKNNCVLIKK